MKGFLALAACVMVLILQTYAQVPSAPCTASMLTTFTPCLNYLTNSSGSGPGGSPTAGCCSSLSSLMANGTGCLCQIVTGGVPFQIPINRSLAVSLPRACNQAGVPLQCQSTPDASVPAPVPVAFAPSASPAGAISPSPLGSIPTIEAPAMAPGSDTTPTLDPPSTAVGSLPPTSSSVTPGTFTPSSAASLSISPVVLAFSVVFMITKHF